MSSIEKESLLNVTSHEVKSGDGYADSHAEFLARFFEQRPYARGDEYDACNISALMNRILDACDVTSKPSRITAFKDLFQLIRVWGMGSPAFPGLLIFMIQRLFPSDGGFTPQLTVSDFNVDLLPASIVLNAPQVYEPLLSMAEECPSRIGGQPDHFKTISAVFGTPLYAAVMACSLDIASRILENEPYLLQKSPINTMDCFAAAITTGCQDVLELLLRYEPPKDWTLRSAVIMSAKRRNIRVAETLLQYAVKGGENFLHPWVLYKGISCASANNDKEMIRLFLDYRVEADPAQVISAVSHFLGQE